MSAATRLSAVPARSIVNGRAVKSCNVLAVQVAGGEVTTIEGITPAEGMHPMQAAFKACHGLQCGFCTPGMVMSAIDLVQHHPHATERADPRGAGRQPVPLHRLPEHRQGSRAGRGRDEVGGDDER